MGLIDTIKNRLFVYDAAQNSPRRRSRSVNLKSEDTILPQSQRRKLVSTTRDLQRNFALAAWAIRKHLDYVSSFNFQSHIEGEPKLNKQIEDLMTWWARPWNVDVAARHPLRRMIRILEAKRCVDGDVFLIKLSSGKLQAIEGDKVRNPSINTPPGHNPDQWVQGVKVTKAGRATKYLICERNKQGGFRYKSEIPAKYVLQHAFWDRFDQVRGVSPIAAALNSFGDVSENVEYALAKAKVAQMFALTFTTESSLDFGAQGDQPLDKYGNPKTPYQIHFDKGPQFLDLDPGDKAEFLESNQPSSQFADFMQQVIALSLKSLDLPYSFHDESFTNFFGSRAAMMQYLKSCKSKRADLQEILDRITFWRINLFIQDGLLKLPRNFPLDNLKWDWVPDGVPWWDPNKDLKADVGAVAAGFETRSDVVRRRTGKDFRDVARSLKEEQDFINELGVALTAPTGEIFNPEAVAPSQEQNN